MAGPAFRDETVDRFRHRRELPTGLWLIRRLGRQLGRRFRRRGGQGGDPFPNDLAIGIRELLLGRHVLIGIGREILKEPALLRLSRHHHRAVVAPLQHGRGRVEFQPAMLFDGAMALHALQVEEGLHLGRPERSRIGPAGMVSPCQYKQQEQGKVASLVHRQTFRSRQEITCQ